MNPDDSDKFLSVLAGVYDFYGRELSTFAGEVWMQACERYDAQQVSKALSAHLMDPERGQFMPKPADIVRQLEGTHTDRSLIAWGVVLETMRTEGAYRSVDFGDPATHKAIEDMGGWTKICRSTLDELPFVQRRFCEAHRVYSQRGAIEAPKYLRGEFEAINSASGKAIAPPVRIQSRIAQDRLQLA